MPVSLGISYTVSLIPRISVIVSTGFAVYSARMFQSQLGKGIRDDGTSYQGLNFWEVGPKAARGFRGGVGVEFNLIKRLAFIVELTGRYLEVKGLRGTRRVEGEAGMHEEKGTLFFYTQWALWFPGRYDSLTIWCPQPWEY